VPLRSSTGFSPAAYSTDRPLDPRDEFGAAGDGTSRPLSADFGTLSDAQVRYPAAQSLADETDWAAIQSVALASQGPGDPAVNFIDSTRPILIPHGIWCVNRPIEMFGLTGVEFLGSGSRTRFAPTAAMASVLHVDGSFGGHYGKFSIEAKNTTELVDSCISYQWTPAVARSSSNNKFSDIEIRNTRFAYGLNIAADPGSDARQIDETGRLERCEQIMYQVGGSAPAMVSLEDIICTLESMRADGRVIDWRSAGVLDLKNVLLNPVSNVGPVSAHVHTDTTNPHVVRLNGVAARRSTAGPGPGSFVESASGPAVVDLGSLVAVDETTGSVVGVHGRKAPHMETFTGDGTATAFGPVNHGLGTTTPTVHVFVDGLLISDGWSATITDADNLTVELR